MKIKHLGALVASAFFGFGVGQAHALGDYFKRPGVKGCKTNISFPRNTPDRGESKGKSPVGTAF